MIHLKSYHDPEDIFQTVFLKYVLSSVTFENEEHEKAWFIRVTINACKDFFKDFFHSHTVSLEELVPQPEELTPDNSEVLEAVLSLPAKYRDVVYLYYYDGYALMSAVDVYHLDYKDALEQILADNGIKEYIMQDQLIAITVFGENENKNSEVLDDVATCTAPYANVYCSSGNSQEVTAAHEAGMSFGKYKAFLELQTLDPDIKAEDIQGLTMRQIWDMIDELSGNTDETSQNDSTGRFGREQHASHGSGQGWGKDRSNGSCQ